MCHYFNIMGNLQLCSCSHTLQEPCRVPDTFSLTEPSLSFRLGFGETMVLRIVQGDDRNSGRDSAVKRREMWYRQEIKMSRWLAGGTKTDQKHLCNYYIMGNLQLYSCSYNSVVGCLTHLSLIFSFGEDPSLCQWETTEFWGSRWERSNMDHQNWGLQGQKVWYQTRGSKKLKFWLYAHFGCNMALEYWIWFLKLFLIFIHGDIS
jgi:hypothetical protein